jgi:hypothetical protein
MRVGQMRPEPFDGCTDRLARYLTLEIRCVQRRDRRRDCVF